MSKPIRWSLIAVFGLLLIFVAPMVLFMAGNFGTAVFDTLLNRRPSSAELVGNYKLLVPWGESTLQMNSDGTFKQEVETNGPERSICGRWQAKDGANFIAIDFRPFGMVWDDDHEREANVYGISFYKPLSGKTYGVVDDDLGERYERQ